MKSTDHKGQHSNFKNQQGIMDNQQQNITNYYQEDEITLKELILNKI